MISLSSMPQAYWPTMYTHIFLHYPCLSLIYSFFAYKITSYEIVEPMFETKREPLINLGRAARLLPTRAHHNNDPCPPAVRCPCPSPPHSRGLQDPFPDDKHELPRKSSALNRHASVPEAIGIRRGSFLEGKRRRRRKHVASCLSRSY